jgi:8-oxo-dGTP pyrophosphatase MutT (NUDIX family)
MRPPSAPRTVKQAAALPFRDLGGQLEICLITTRTSGRWSIPKGFIDPGDTAAGTARKEAGEEAGVRGRVVGSPVGYYEITKGGATYTVAVYLLHVDRVDAQWDEQDLRTRRWVTADEAVGLLKGHPVEAVFRRGLTQITARAVHREGSTP